MRVKINGLKELERTLAKSDRNIRRGVRAIIRKAADYGKTRAVLHSRREGVRATGAYDAGFVTAPTSKGGMVIANASEHAIFVERGRRPGRRPPVSAIMKWLVAKGLITLKLPRMSDRAARTEIAKAGGGITGDVARGAQRARLRAIGKRRVASHKRQVRKRAIAKAYGFAHAVARKIGRRGTKGRFILRAVSVDVAKFVKAELRKMAAALAGR